MGWNFQREEDVPRYEVIPEGKHRIRVREVEAAKSKSGNDMLVIQFDVSGFDSVLFHYITFLNDRPEITNRMLTQFFDSFKDIPEGNFRFADWKGKTGACVIKHEQYNGNPSAKLSYFIKADKQGDLPPWKEPQTAGAGAGIPDGFEEVVVVNDSDLPF